MNLLTEQLLELVAEDDPLNPFVDGAVPALDGALADLDEDAERDRHARALSLAAAARDAGDLDEVTRGVVVQQAEAIAARLDARLVEHTVLDYAVSPLARVLTSLPRMRPQDAAGEQRFLERLAGVPKLLASAAERHRAGLASGRLPVAHRVRGAIARVDAYLADPAADPLRRPELGPRSSEQRDRVLAGDVRRALAAYRDALANELEPAGRPPERPGLCWLPGGEATYAALVGVHTTTTLNPDEIHRIGMEQVERFGDEYAAQAEECLGTREPSEIRRRKAEDPGLRWQHPQQPLTVAREAIERAQRVMPELVGRLPRRDAAVEETPATEAPHASNAFYVPASLDGSRSGTFYLNTYRYSERDRSLAEATAFHEVVPGHHFQITLASERTELPLIRRVAWINSYLEGWAVYGERLADWAGLYSSGFYRLGMLAHDLNRSARLVVDTGLHALGWERERAIEFLRERSAMSELELQHETDRYIEMPGQALAYMIGRLEFERLRERAESTLGGAFDVRSFHDAMLATGPVPLDVLDGALARWAEEVVVR